MSAEEHNIGDYDRRAQALEMVGYSFKVSSREWMVIWRSTILVHKVLFTDEGSSDQAFHRAQAHENMKKAVDFATGHVQGRVARREAMRLHN